MRAKADEEGKKRPKVLQKSAEEECEYRSLRSISTVFTCVTKNVLYLKAI